MTTPFAHSRDPLHGITLEHILTHLVAQYGWEKMARRIPVRCFLLDPSIKSSLTFFRKTPWARKKVEAWFLEEQWRATEKAKEIYKLKTTDSKANVSHLEVSLDPPFYQNYNLTQEEVSIVEGDAK